MKTTALIRPPAAPGPAAPRSDAGDNASPVASERRTFGEMFGELIPLIDAVAGYGPPVIFLAGPWLLLGLMLSGPFAFLVVLVVFVAVAATVLVALGAAIVVVPYLLAHRLHRHRAPHAFGSEHAAQLVPIESPRVVA
jgi:hypothetical protein